MKEKIKEALIYYIISHKDHYMKLLQYSGFNIKPGAWDYDYQTTVKDSYEAELNYLVITNYAIFAAGWEAHESFSKNS